MKSVRFVSSIAICLIVLAAAGRHSLAHAANAVATSPSSESQKSAVSFAAAVTYNTSGYSTSVAIGDLNGDGHPDLIVTNQEEDSAGLRVLLGNGDGTFQPAVTYGSGEWDTSVAIADVNGDGKPDLIVAGWYQGCCIGGVGVLLGNGDGTFQAEVIYNSGGYYAESVAVSDVNGDGHPDLLIVNSFDQICCDGQVAVLLGNGDGTFQPAVTYDSGGDAATAIVVADVNGDGKADLIVANECQTYGDCPSGGGVSVLLGNGDGAFRPAASYNSGGFDSVLPTSVAVADVNGDGHPDLVVTFTCQSYGNCPDGFGPGGVSVLLGNGDGTFQEQGVPYNSGGIGATSVAIADVNGDSYPDLVVTNWCIHPNCKGGGNGSVAVLLGYGDGTFQAPVSYGVGGHGRSYTEPYSFAIADVNGDGRADIVTANAYSGTVGVLLNNFSVATTDTVQSSLNPSKVNQSVTFTATIASASAVPNGELVTFYNGTTTLGTSPTLNGVARLTTSFSKAKNYTIKAEYPGDAFHKKRSGTIKQVVNP